MLLYPPPPGEPIETRFDLAILGETKERREITMGGDSPRSVVQLIDGDRFVEYEQGVPTGRDLRDEIRNHRRYRRLLPDLLDPATPGVSLVAPPGADLDSTLVLEWSAVAAERWQAWFDARTGLPTRIRRITRADGGGHVDEDVLDDPIRVGTRLIPRHVVTWRDGRRVAESWLLDRDETTALDDAWFELPENP